MPKPFGQSCTWASASYPMPISSNLPNVHVSGQGSRNRLPPSPNILEHDKVLRLLGFTNRILSYLMDHAGCCGYFLLDQHGAFVGLVETKARADGDASVVAARARGAATAHGRRSDSRSATTLTDRARLAHAHCRGVLGRALLCQTSRDHARYALYVGTRRF